MTTKQHRAVSVIVLKHTYTYLSSVLRLDIFTHSTKAPAQTNMETDKQGVFGGTKVPVWVFCMRVMLFKQDGDSWTVALMFCVKSFNVLSKKFFLKMIFFLSYPPMISLTLLY